MRFRAIVASACVTTTLGVVACAPPPEVVAPGWPSALADFSIVWRAEKGVDLVDAPAVPVRAFVESYLLAQIVGDTNYLYLGFTDAVADNARPGKLSPLERPWIGTATNLLLSLTRSGSTVTAIGCQYTYAAAAPDSQERLVARAFPPSSPDAGIAAFKMTLTAPDSPTGDQRVQEGPERTPTVDVFGGYRVTGFWGGYTGTQPARLWPEQQNSAQDCRAKAPDPVKRRSFLTGNYLPRKYFPALPASPGWPVKPAEGQ